MLPLLNIGAGALPLLGNKKIMTPILYMAGAVLAYHFVAKPVLGNLGLINSTQKKQEAELKQITQNITPDQLSLPEFRYRELAEIIYVALYNPMANDDEEAVYGVFEQLSTQQDVLKLIDKFGFRARNIGVLNTSNSFSLGAFLTAAMNTKEIAKINNILARKTIPYRF